MKLDSIFANLLCVSERSIGICWRASPSHVWVIMSTTSRLGSYDAAALILRFSSEYKIHVYTK